MNAEEMGATVERRRKALGLGQEELAELSGVSVRFVRALEHGKATARLDKVLDLIAALGLEVDLRIRQQ